MEKRTSLLIENFLHFIQTVGMVAGLYIISVVAVKAFAVMLLSGTIPYDVHTEATITILTCSLIAVWMIAMMWSLRIFIEINEEGYKHFCTKVEALIQKCATKIRSK